MLLDVSPVHYCSFAKDQVLSTTVKSSRTARLIDTRNILVSVAKFRSRREQLRTKLPVLELTNHLVRVDVYATAKFRHQILAACLE